jgi:hypothetical protein
MSKDLKTMRKIARRINKFIFGYPKKIRRKKR